MLFLSNQDIVHFGIWRFIFVLTILFGTSFLGMRDITLYIFSRPLTLGLDDIFLQFYSAYCFPTAIGARRQRQ